MTRTALESALLHTAIVGAVCTLVLLAGCTTNERPDRATVAAHELVGFEWCSPAQRHQCAMIRQGGDLLQMNHPSRIGGPTPDWDVRGLTVDAFSEDE